MAKKTNKDDRIAKDLKAAAGKMRIGQTGRNWIIFIIVLIALFIGFYYFFSSWGKIEYEGLTFLKEDVGPFDIYTYKYSFFSKQKGQIITNNFYVRIDPRENDVPFGGEIEYPNEGKNISISYDTENLGKCNYSTIAAAGLGQFLATNQYKVLAGEYNKDYANKTKNPYIRCENNRDVMTIEIFASDETRIVRDNLNCYKIKVANCEVLKAIEKFELQSLVDAKLRSSN